MNLDARTGDCLVRSLKGPWLNGTVSIGVSRRHRSWARFCTRNPPVYVKLVASSQKTSAHTGLNTYIDTFSKIPERIPYRSSAAVGWLVGFETFKKGLVVFKSFLTSKVVKSRALKNRYKGQKHPNKNMVLFLFSAREAGVSSVNHL